MRDPSISGSTLGAPDVCKLLKKASTNGMIPCHAMEWYSRIEYGTGPNIVFRVIIYQDYREYSSCNYRMFSYGPLSWAGVCSMDPVLYRYLMGISNFGSTSRAHGMVDCRMIYGILVYWSLRGKV